MILLFLFDPTRRFSGQQLGRKANRRTGEKRTAEPQNNEPQNVEGWFRCAQSIFIKMGRFPPAPHRRGGGLSPPGNVGNLRPEKLAVLLGGDEPHKR